LVQIHTKGYEAPIWYTDFLNNLFNLSSIILSLIKIEDNHQYKETGHVYAIVRTSPRATHVVRTGDLVPASTMLVTTPVA